MNMQLDHLLEVPVHQSPVLWPVESTLLANGGEAPSREF